MHKVREDRKNSLKKKSAKHLKTTVRVRDVNDKNHTEKQGLEIGGNQYGNVIGEEEQKHEKDTSYKYEG